MLNITIFRWQIYREWPAFYFIWFSLLFVSILLLRSVYLVQIISNKCETEFLGVLSGRLSILGAWDQHKGFSFIFYSTTKVRYILNILWEKWDKLKVNDWDLGTILLIGYYQIYNVASLTLPRDPTFPLGPMTFPT